MSIIGRLVAHIDALADRAITREILAALSPLNPWARYNPAETWVAGKHAEVGLNFSDPEEGEPSRPEPRAARHLRAVDEPAAADDETDEPTDGRAAR